MAYLEQSTRYIAYNDRLGGRWRYLVPAEIRGTDLEARYVACLDGAFETYARWIEPIEHFFQVRYPRAPGDPKPCTAGPFVPKRWIRCVGSCPPRPQSSVGLFGTAQAYEALLLRMRVHPLLEAREYADLMLAELRKIIPSFLKRVDRPDRGGRWGQYLQIPAPPRKRWRNGCSPGPRLDRVRRSC